MAENRPLHRVAMEGFGQSVQAYRRSRPSYPQEAVAWLIEALRIARESVVADVGAGTGKFTALLAATGATLIAIEPLEQMRAALAEELPSLRILAGRAEELPLADRSVDAIVVAQAFHWFDLPRALPEFSRVLRPRGRLGVIWNELDVSVDWVARFNEIIAVPRHGTPHPSEAREAELGRWFSTPVHAAFRHVHLHDRESLLERVSSMSFVAVQPEAERERIYAAVVRLADEHPDLAERQEFELPYLAECWWAERSKR